MKTIAAFGIALITLSNFVYSQTGAEKKQQEKVAFKPSIYDSTQILQEQYTPENQYQFVGLQLLLPPVINPEKGPIVFSKQSKGFGKGTKHYTVIDILKGDVLAQLKAMNLTNQCGSKYKDLNSPEWKNLSIDVVFVLRDNDRKDSLNNSPLYWVVCQGKKPVYRSSYFNVFIPVPYYEKQKQSLKNQSVISIKDKSIWMCKDITIQKIKTKAQDSTCEVVGSLVNDKGQKMKLPTYDDSLKTSFITKKEYDWLDNANSNTKRELYAKLNAQREKRKAECIAKFGKKFGRSIAQDSVKAGMTTDMCKAAWGAPWDIAKTKAASGTNEVWSYNWKYNLYFENGILIKIEH